jgi:hypothetical protein
MPGDTNGAVIAFQKDSSVLTVTIVNVDGTVTVSLTMV